jgi:hypothetical protein
VVPPVPPVAGGVVGATGVAVDPPVSAESVSVFVFRSRFVSGVVSDGLLSTPRSDGVLLGSGSSPPPLAISTISSRKRRPPAPAAISRRRL